MTLWGKKVLATSSPCKISFSSAPIPAVWLIGFVHLNWWTDPSAAASLPLLEYWCTHGTVRKYCSSGRFTKGQPEAQAAELDLEWEYIGKEEMLWKREAKNATARLKEQRRAIKGIIRAVWNNSGVCFYLCGWHFWGKRHFWVTWWVSALETKKLITYWLVNVVS